MSVSSLRDKTLHVVLALTELLVYDHRLAHRPIPHNAAVARAFAECEFELLKFWNSWVPGNVR